MRFDNHGLGQVVPQQAVLCRQSVPGETAATGSRALPLPAFAVLEPRTEPGIEKRRLNACILPPINSQKKWLPGPHGTATVHPIPCLLMVLASLLNLDPDKKLHDKVWVSYTFPDMTAVRG